MRKLMAVLCVGLTLCFVAGMLVAAGGAGADKGAAGQLKAQGKVSAVDTTKKTLAIAGADGNTLTFILTDDTKVTAGRDTEKAITDLQVGTNVSVTYTKDGDKMTAVSVKILAGGGKGGKGKGGGGGGGGGN